MRQLLPCLVVVCSLSACAQERSPTPQRPPAHAPVATTNAAPAAATSIDARLVTLKSVYAARSSDAPAVARAYAENATLRFGDGTELHGRAAIEASARNELAKLGTPAYGISRSWIKGDTVIVEDVTRASVKGRDVGVRGLGVYWFDASGLIKEHHQYRNDPDMDDQIAGAPEAAKPAPMAVSMETHAVDGATDDATSAAWVGRFDLAWTQGPGAVAPYLADDVWFSCTLGVDEHGKRAYLETVKKFGGNFLDEKVTIDHVWAVGEFLVTEETMRATAAKSGKPVVLRFGEVFQVRNDKLVNDWAFGDARNFAPASAP